MPWENSLTNKRVRTSESQVTQANWKQLASLARMLALLPRPTPAKNLVQLETTLI